MKNIHVIQTDKPSRLYINARYKHYEFCELPRTSTAYKKCHNIYITSDEEIMEGDWFIRDGSIHKCFRVHKTDIEFLTSIDSVYCGSNTFWSKGFCKKIILTTDQDLIKDGVQAIDDEFLEWFVKNPSCESVEVDILWNDNENFTHDSYELIIPKEEQKQHLIDMMQKDEELRLYDVFNDEKRQGIKELIDKHKQTDEKGRPITYWGGLEEPKQETLDEIEIISKQRIHKYRPMNPHPTSFFIGFRDGYKLARETSYSKEEVLEIIRQYALEEHLITSSKPDIWFEQFKKK